MIQSLQAVEANTPGLEPMDGASVTARRMSTTPNYFHAYPCRI